MKKNFYLFFLLLPVMSVFGQLTDVWDFGGQQLDAAQYSNKLNSSVINSWYNPVITPGSSSTANVFPASFTAGDLVWTGGNNDRLRTTNTALTRYDENIASVTGYTGRLYCNAIPTVTGGQPNARYFKINLNEDDEVKVVARGDTAGMLTFSYASNPSSQSDNVSTTAASGSVSEANFVAKTAGNYFIYDALAKASFYRIYRKAAVYTSVTGNIDVSQASGIPAGYSLVFTNTAGKIWNVPVNSNAYQINLPVGYSYTVSLVNASGYIITAGETFSTVGASSTLSHPVSVSAVSLATVTGNITGLETDISNLGLIFTPDPASGSIYVPSPVINTANSTYSVQLAPGVQYTISAQGVNDFAVTNNTITVAGNTNSNINFSVKPKYLVSLNVSGLNATQQNALNLTFTNINETGYAYSFSDLSNINLRNGKYKISASGLNSFPVELALTSNLNVNGAPASKNLVFNPVNIWSFDDQQINSTTTVYYKGMQLNGQVTTVPASGHLTAKPGASFLVPVNPGQKVIVSYYYSANFSIESGTSYSTASNSTSVTESAEYVYPGSVPGNVTIAVGGAAGSTSYFTEIRTVQNVAYASEITVGAGKQFQTINDALNAVSNMTRNDSQRVTVLVDPGNYEEMLVISQPNITLKNASPTPDTSILNKGADISPNAARVTSYYGHGYNYYSMGSNQKWSQEILNVNKENGSFSYANTGSGTTNGSFWNATVVVNSKGFEADGIIFENSFNQYISAKESQDVVVPWTSGSPGTRPMDVKNTSVQNKALVERAAALAITGSGDRTFLKNCRIVGRQDSFYGAQGARVALYKGDVMGAVDFIFGGMTAVFYQTNLVMNTSDQGSDLSYITAPQQTSGRGYLMYNCKVTSAQPMVQTASAYRSKPGYFGRPWAANTSEAVFYNTTVEVSDFPGSVGNSLIMPLGWQNTLGGTSPGMYEYGTTELSGVNNSGNRAAWATFLTQPQLTDGTAITTFNFTKGNDGWDPFSETVLGTGSVKPVLDTKIFSVRNTVYIHNVKNTTAVKVYAINGTLMKSFALSADRSFELPAGIWLIHLQNSKGTKSVKLRID